MNLFARLLLRFFRLSLAPADARIEQQILLLLLLLLLVSQSCKSGSNHKRASFFANSFFFLRSSSSRDNWGDFLSTQEKIRFTWWWAPRVSCLWRTRKLARTFSRSNKPMQTTTTTKIIAQELTLSWLFSFFLCSCFVVFLCDVFCATSEQQQLGSRALRADKIGKLKRVVVHTLVQAQASTNASTSAAALCVCVWSHMSCIDQLFADFLRAFQKSINAQKKMSSSSSSKRMMLMMMMMRRKLMRERTTNDSGADFCFFFF